MPDESVVSVVDFLRLRLNGLRPHRGSKNRVVFGQEIRLIRDTNLLHVALSNYSPGTNRKLNEVCDFILIVSPRCIDKRSVDDSKCLFRCFWWIRKKNFI